MNIYGVIALVFSIVILAHVFGAIEPIRNLIESMADVPLFENYRGDQNSFVLAVRLAYLIVLVALVKLLFSRKED